ncbi:MAG: hypothetical protein WCL43_05025 [Chlorobium sp.]
MQNHGWLPRFHERYPFPSLSGNVRQIDADPASDEEIEQLLRRVVSSESFGRRGVNNDEFRISACLWHKGQWMKPHGTPPTK